jgi:hypothetical protein
LAILPMERRVPMATDHIRYDILAQQALRDMVRTVLADAAKNGLPGDHHFYITFETAAEGVKVSSRVQAQYPQEMTIILQHQFWDLAVTEDSFEVGLSFAGVAERLLVPFSAIRSFVDPSVQFALQFQDAEAADAAAATPPPAAGAGKDAGVKPRPPARHKPGKAVPAVTAPVAANPPGPDGTPTPEKPAGSGEVVRLDRFRKK